jgi:signal transduction histidine kinase
VSVDHPTAPIRASLRQTRGSQEAVVRWLRLLAPLLLAGYILAAFRADPGPGLSGRGLAITLAVAAFPIGVLGVDATARNPFRQPYLVFMTLLLAGPIALLCLQPHGPGAAGMLVAVVCAARLLPRRAVVPVLVTAFVGLEAVAAISDQGFGSLAVLAALAAFYGMLILAFRLGEANKRAERLLAELEQSQAEQARAAGMAERQRLAREMHDVLAHSLSGLMLQLEGARMLAADDPGDPRLSEVIDRAHHLGKSGLDEARRAIGMLRDDELPGVERLAGLAAQFEADRQVACRLSVTGSPRPLDPQARLALYRVAQEALTNITKHARPERVELRLAYDAARTRLTVEDFALTAAADPAAGGIGGYGLTGMRERAELLGGRLTAGRTAHGFRVELDVPVDEPTVVR